jgi:agmatinase
MADENDRPGAPPFLGAPLVLEPGDAQAEFVFLGIPFGEPYDMRNVAPPAAEAPATVRRAAARFASELDHWDFDLGGPLFAGRQVRLVDCGDVPGDPRDLEGNARRATEVVRAATAGGAVPLVVGGDHAIPPLVVRALEARGPIEVLHIDAHLDFRDEVDGVRGGFSSPIRRLRELPWIRSVVQVGLRGIGSARRREVLDAQMAGNMLITADEFYEHGPEWVAEQFSPGAHVYITIDVDGIDPVYAPGTIWPEPGGLTSLEAKRLVRQVIGRGELVGMDVCEFAPARDVNDATALLVTRLLMNALGAAVRRR